MYMDNIFTSDVVVEIFIFPLVPSTAPGIVQCSAVDYASGGQQL